MSLETLAQARIHTPEPCGTGLKETLAGRPRKPHDCCIEPLIDHNDVTTIMRMLSGIEVEVRRIRIFLEDDDGEEEEELPEGNA